MKRNRSRKRNSPGRLELLVLGRPV
ncbi:hypothetical protein FCULG_00001758 [Fusarium culmorum]|uniref:Uncharacterized protein n=1 Tax=Fusarium culmorum TaxID=5516 RepID=A0A2T4GKD8_FUSCU|nr:hypothetical protein FCULG_00001758 [Fusarium culmorum]